LVLHVKPQLPLQVAVPFAGIVQLVQPAPQCMASVLPKQAVPHAWKPAVHVTPQLVPSQVAVPFDGVGQAEQLEPQLATLLDDRHCVPHA
jgi:hypothetical protein